MNRIYLRDILKEETTNIYGYNTDYGNRDYAVTCIKGNILKGNCHKDTLEEYLESPDEYLDYSEGFVTEQEQEDINERMFFASVLTHKDENSKYIVVYESSIFKYDIDEVISILSKNFKDHIVCIDNTDRTICHDNPYILKVC